MKQLIPNQFLFRFTFRCSYAKKLLGRGNHLVDLPASHRLPYMGTMDQRPEFAELRVGWNEKGLGVVWQVPHKEQAIYGEADRPTACDSLSLWLDMRDTRTIHRASRFCQRFLIMVHDGGEEGLARVTRRPIHRALEDPPSIDLSDVQLKRFALNEDGDATNVRDASKIKSYRMEVFFPESCLPGFDPESNRRLGFFYRIRDRELGDQLSGAAPELPYWEDPSLWSTLELE